MSLHRIRQTAVAWMKRVKVLEGGEEIEKLSINELKKIIYAQEVSNSFYFCVLHWLNFAVFVDNNNRWGYNEPKRF